MVLEEKVLYSKKRFLGAMVKKLTANKPPLFFIPTFSLSSTVPPGYFDE